MSKRDKVIIDKLSNKKNIESNIEDIFFEDKSDKKFSNQAF